MLVQAPAMEMRIPVRMPGRADRICTRSMVYRREAPSVRAHSRRSSGTSSSAATVVTAMIGVTPKTIRTSLGIPDPEPDDEQRDEGQRRQRAEYPDDRIDQMPRDQGSGHSGAQGYTDDDTDGEADHDTAQAEECVIPERLALRRVRPVQAVHESVRGLGDRRQEYRIRDEMRRKLPHHTQVTWARRPR